MKRIEPLVSVVTPVYNSAETIGECVRSVLGQTYERFEYIVCDNCSTDGTPELVLELAAGDERVRLIRPKEFIGPDPNANRALREIATGSSYVKVVHADDWLFPSCLERMVDLAVANESVGVVGAYRQEGEVVTLQGLPADIEVVPGRDACRNHLLGRPWGYLFGSPTSVLYRADLVRLHPEFYPLANPYQSDQEACLALLLESDFGFVHEVLTYTRRHTGADSSYYVRVGAEEPSQLKMLLTYGPEVLTHDEYERRVAARVLAYAWRVLRCAGRLADPEVRGYHAEVIRAVRGSISVGEIARGVRHALRRRVAL